MYFFFSLLLEHEVKNTLIYAVSRCNDTQDLRNKDLKRVWGMLGKKKKRERDLLWMTLQKKKKVARRSRKQEGRGKVSPKGGRKRARVEHFTK